MVGMIWTLGLLGVAAVLLLVQSAQVFGRLRGVVIGSIIAVTLGGSWWLLGRFAPTDAGPADWAKVESVTSETCAKCHPDHYESWRRTYHRTMTRETTPENVKGDFNHAVHEYQGLRTWLTREGDAFFMETVHPDWAELRARAGDRTDGLPPPRHVKLKVDRLVGSHWIQECLHRDPTGRYRRLPVLYHITEKRWVHTNGAFLAPDTHDFWDKSRAAVWNDTCLYCHNTGPSKNPAPGPGGVNYRTTVVELGIACEACHGPAADHVRLNHNPARRLALQQSGDADPSIVHPERLSVPRRDEICARCHGATVPKPWAWNPRTIKDPFIPGQELTKYNWLFWSEAEQAVRAGHRPPHPSPSPPGGEGPGVRGRPEPTDGRFWGDGTPLTTALEYNGMALSPCYQNGKGTLSCLSCHTMHGDDPNLMLKPKMQTNEACYQCHGDYRNRLTQHTRHGADSPGSLCYNCHMPHQVYSLLTTHRSHRIQIPDVKDSLDTGKPHACNLCHLDKSLGWTRDQLGKWSDRQRVLPRELTADEENVSSAVLLMSQADARTRAIVAGAFSNPDALRASGTDWIGPFLTRLIEDDRYPVVRYLAHRGWSGVHGEAASGPFDYLALPAKRASQLQAIKTRFDAVPIRKPYPYLPLTPKGLPDEAVLSRLREKRNDPDVTINE